MSENKWDEIDPKYVPSICYNLHKEIFLNTKRKSEDPKRVTCAQRFKEHIEKALQGKEGFKINAKRLFVD